MAHALALNAEHEEKLDKKRIRLVDAISFLVGFSQAVLIYVTSSYFKEALGTENVGYLYIISYAIVLGILLNFHKVIKSIGKSYVFFLVLFLNAFSLFFLLVLPPSPAGAFFLIINLIATALGMVSMDIILESFSTDKVSGRVRGLYLTVLEAGFLLGPFLSARTLERFGFKDIFLFAMLINLTILASAFVGLNGVNHRFKKSLTVGKLLAKVWIRKDELKIYYVSFVLESFYAIMVIFSPLYLRDLGIPWEKIGLMFTIMLLPFVILPFPLGYLADKRNNERKMIFSSLLLMSIATFSIFFLKTTNFFVWTLILLCTRLGAASIQVLRDSYFYKKIDGRDVDLINFFRTAMPVAYIFTMIISSLLLSIASLKFIFIFLALLIFSALYPAARLGSQKRKK